MAEKDIQHPGHFVRSEVIPTGMTVKKAAELISVGRPALSNFLNGNAALSPDMALRLEKAFGANREELLAMQRSYDAQQNSGREKEFAVRGYAAPFLGISATQIASWADRTETRGQLAALLRRLINSTGEGLTKVDFPAFDNSQRPEWDGTIETDTATPWIPSGLSGWEFGCAIDPRSKANNDYESRLASVAPPDKKKMTFVFVTPRNWLQKNAWANEKRAENIWKDVRAFDASDLEQWLEQSIPAQNWLASIIGISTPGILTLDECWAQWADAVTPELSKTLFADALKTHGENLKNWLKTPPSRPFVITSDSEDESLAFVAGTLAPLEEFADRVVVLKTTEALRKVVASSREFIAVLANSEVERASAGLHNTVHTIIIRQRSGVENEPDAELGLVSDETFRAGLIAMGIDDQEIRHWSLASGQSLTILRRRMSNVPAIRQPPWAEDNALARKLIPFGFAGAWDSQSKADREILIFLMGVNVNYDAIEQEVHQLQTLDQSPVWTVGRYRGVASKLDVFFATHRLVTQKDLENFMSAAEQVLLERDPTLDLPEEKRYAASLYGKTREHSAALRKGICETLVLLAVHGKQLFKKRLGYEVEAAVNTTVRQLLMPFSAETWASQRGDLPHYAEAAPDLFLDIVENDLKESDSKILTLLKPSDSGIFGGGCPRSGLLWALEALAWKPERLPRVALLLARLCEIKIDDNWGNKPENTLQSLFRAWMPQTAANTDERIGALEVIIQRFPDVGLRICFAQINKYLTMGHYNNRPHWRNDASGVGHPIGGYESYKFRRRAADLVIAWPRHDERTLGDLIKSLEVLEEADHELVWQKVRDWIATNPDDEKKAALRERIRRHSLMRSGVVDAKSTANRSTAQEIYDQLAPVNPVDRHRWLFAEQWVHESWDELSDGTIDFDKHEERIEAIRAEAIGEVWAHSGYAGIFRLCLEGNAAQIIGFQLARLPLPKFESVEFAKRLLRHDGGATEARLDQCLRGHLFALDDSRRETILKTLVEMFKSELNMCESNLLRMLICAPCKRSTWKILEGLATELQGRYWHKVFPDRYVIDNSELPELVDRLLLAKRPKAAFEAAGLKSGALESPTLLRLLRDIATVSSEIDAKFQFHSFETVRVFEVLDSRTDISREELAQLEFLFLEALEDEKRGIPNLEREFSESPTLFCQLVGMSFKRKDGNEDLPESRIVSDDARENAAMQAYRLLRRVRRIPGTDEAGNIDTRKLIEWIRGARSTCIAIGRGDSADSCLGEVLSKSPRDPDGIWPCQSVREALEEIGNERIMNGMSIGMRNQRGAHWRDEGGKQERDLASQYRGWSKQAAFKWPFTARLLDDIAQSYDREAGWQDTDAEIRKRLPY